MEYKVNLEKILNNTGIAMFFIYMITYNIFSYRANTVIISEIILLILLIIISLYIIFIKKYIRAGSFLIFLFIYNAYLFINIYFSINKSISFEKIKTLLLLIAFSYMLYNFFDNKLKIRQGLVAITYSYIILGIYTLNKYGFSNLFSGIVSKRIGSDISQENVLGTSLAIGAVLCFYFALYKGKKIYYLYFIFLFIMSSFTQSRKALFSVLVGIIILVFLKNRMKNFLKTFLLLLLAIIVLYILLKLPIFEGVLSRVNGIFDTSKPMEASAFIRKNMIKDGIEYFCQKPLIGYGYDCFRELGYYNTYSHNNYIEMLINGGILSFIIYYGLYLYIIIKLIPNIFKFDSVSIIFFTMIIIQLIMDFAEVSYSSKIIYIYFALYFSYINIETDEIKLYERN